MYQLYNSMRIWNRYESGPNNTTAIEVHSLHKQSYFSVFSSLLLQPNLNVNKPRSHLNISVYMILPMMYTSFTEAVWTVHPFQRINTVYNSNRVIERCRKLLNEQKIICSEKNKKKKNWSYKQKNKQVNSTQVNITTMPLMTYLGHLTIYKPKFQPA